MDVKNLLNPESRKMKAEQALIITWNGFQDQELVYPYYRLLGAGIDTKIVADSHDDKGRIYGILGVNMPCHITLKNFLQNANSYLEDFDLLILPGGVKSLEKLRQEKGVIRFINDWHKQQKTIASTCHGAQLLISAEIVKGRKIAGYYSIEDDLRNAGAIYSREPVVEDGLIVTSPHYDHMGPWMEKAIQVMRSKSLN